MRMLPARGARSAATISTSRLLPDPSAPTSAARAPDGSAKLARSIVSSGMVYDYRLTTEIRRFEVDVSTHEARIEIVARIVAGANGRVLATQTFAAPAPAPPTPPRAPLTADGAAARALDIAAQDATARILRWTVAAI